MLHQTLFFILLLFFIIIITSTSSHDFLFNSFNATDVRLIGDARVGSSVISLTNDLNKASIGRAFYPSPIPFKPNSSSTTISSFSTSFVFSILPSINSSPGCGLAFVLSNSISHLPGVNSGRYFGLFSNSTVRSVAPLIAVTFDTGRNPEFEDPNDNYVGINLNNIESTELQTAGYFDRNRSFFNPVNMSSGQNIQAWIDFDGTKFEINVTIAPAGDLKPFIPLINFKDPVISNYVSTEMFVGFSASKKTWVEARRVLAWSLSDTGILRDINVTNLPVFLPQSMPSSSSSSSLSAGAIAGISVASVVFLILCLFGIYWFWWTRKKCKIDNEVEEEDDDDVEDWELEYWPHRFSYEELFEATKGFSRNELLGSGGFGKVYKGSLPNNSEVAVKCVARDSKQGLREFMAEISSIGRLQHKNLVRMRGWYRKGNELMLVYDYMPNGSLNTWIFDKPKQLLGWEGRRRVIVDVAEGLNYLHYGWDHVVLHRDIKSSNILLDSEFRGRLGDFGLAELYQHGKLPSRTGVVGTRGYLAPELAIMASPTAASDVYSFGVVVLEIVCGKRPIGSLSDEEPLLIDWVRKLNEEGKLSEAGDERIVEEYKIEEMESMLKLGLACCHPDPQRRPTMKEVVAVLVGEDTSIVPACFLSDFGRSNDVDDWCSIGGAYEFSSRVYISPRT